MAPADIEDFQHIRKTVHTAGRGPMMLFDIDQRLEALEDCYGFTGEPYKVDRETYSSEPLAMRVLRFGSAARSRIHMPGLAEDLIRSSDDLANNPRAAVEYAWLLSSHQEWQRMSRLLQRNTCPSLPAFMADLVILATYRCQKERFQEGIDEAGLRRELEASLRGIERSWPEETDRHAVYRGMIEHSCGNYQKGRELIAANCGELRLISAFCGAHTVLAFSEPRPPQVPIHVKAVGRFATLVSVDLQYYKRYATSFTRLHRALDSDRTVHFHCIGFDPAEHPIELDGPTGFTVDSNTPDPTVARTYYACARYLHLGAYLDSYENAFCVRR